MRTEILSNPVEVEAAWSRQYDRLARIFAALLGRKRRKLAELGCGRGQLTIPLAKRATDTDVVLVDRFAGTRTVSSSKGYKVLMWNLEKAKLKGRTRIVVSDYLEWITTQGDGTYDAVISSEFLPEIDSAETSRLMQHCYRLVKAGGVTVHSFLSPIPRNSRQRLLNTADSNPLWTRTPPKEWFSPRPELVTKELRKSGFHRIRKITLGSRLVIRADAARSLLRDWAVKASFYEAHMEQLNRDGLEVPDWIIISGVKP